MLYLVTDGVACNGHLFQVISIQYCLHALKIVRLLKLNKTTYE
jgi:hypothetical protein